MTTASFSVLLLVSASLFVWGCVPLPASLQNKMMGLETRSPGELDSVATGKFPIVPMALVDEHGNVEIEIDDKGSVIIKGTAYGRIQQGVYRIPMSDQAYGLAQDGSFWATDAKAAYRLGKVVENRFEQIDGTRYIINEGGTVVLESKSGDRKWPTKHFRATPTGAYPTAVLLLMVSKV
jgi:hypothetical protein